MVSFGLKSLFPELMQENLSGLVQNRSLPRAGRSTLILLVSACLLFCTGLSFSPPARAATVNVEAVHSQDKYPAGGSYPIVFKIRIPSTWYIHGSNESGKDLLATELSFPKTSEVKITDIQFPAPAKKKFDYAYEAIELFSGEILVRAMLKVSKKTPPNNLTLKGLLTYQACTSKFCVPPEEVPVPLNLSIAPPGTKIKHLNRDVFKTEDSFSASHQKFLRWGAGAGLWLTLFGIFLGGMALNLTPCIYPLIPITVSYFGGMSNQIRGRTIIHGLLYVSSLAITNSLLGVTASLTGSVLGYFLQKPVVLMLVAGILFFLALSFFDLWEFQLPSGLTRLASKNFGGYFGTFFMGLTLGIVAAPCLGPFMLGLLTYVAQIGDPYVGFLYFFVLSIGMGLPLAVLAVFSGGLKKLPLSGGWLMWIRKGLGWVLVGMAAYMLQPLITVPTGKTTSIAIILASAGVHLGWLDRSQGTLPFFPYFKKGVGTLLILIGVTFFLFASAGVKGKGVQWEAYDPVLLKEASQNNKPVILDFYAEWCGPCRALDEKVFMDPEVVELSLNFVAIRVDMTKEHPDQKKLQEQFKIIGMPTIIFINRQGVVEGEKIESFVGRDVLIKRMKRLIEES